jgi:acetyltransferase-like isoleucine patch superfamily enzyme
MEENVSKKPRGREIFSKYKKIISLFVAYYKLFPLKKRIKLFVKHRNSRGKIGLGIRYALLKSIAKSCGDNVSVFEGVFLLNPQNLSVGNNVSIQPLCYIECGNDENGGLVIEDDVSIAHGVTVMTTTHTYEDESLPIKDQPVVSKKVVIKNNVWIGAKATILAGNTVNSGSIVGAAAVVTKDVPENSIVAGVPAKVIKTRNTEHSV